MDEIKVELELEDVLLMQQYLAKTLLDNPFILYILPSCKDLPVGKLYNLFNKLVSSVGEQKRYCENCILTKDW